MAAVKNPRWVGTVYADKDYVKWNADKDITTLAWVSQASGFFVDIYPKDGSAPEEIVSTYFSDGNFERLERCKVLAVEKGIDSINVALAYVLSQGLPIGAIVGPRKESELLSTMSVEEIQLTPQEVAWLNLETSTR